MGTPEQQTALEPTANGSPGLVGDDAIIAAIEQKRVGLYARAEELKAELAKITPELRRYEKAIMAIRGEPLGNPQGKRPGPKPKTAAAGVAKKVSEETIERTWEAIQQLAVDGDEFTQVQARAVTGDKSSTSSLAFEALRQDGRIRFARQQGLHKYFRLGSVALSETES
jgi:hypothetical protein